jgi:hypothetical protein
LKILTFFCFVRSGVAYIYICIQYFGDHFVVLFIWNVPHLPCPFVVFIASSHHINQSNINECFFPVPGAFANELQFPSVSLWSSHWLEQPNAPLEADAPEAIGSARKK